GWRLSRPRIFDWEIWASFAAPIVGGVGHAVFPFAPGNEGSGAPTGAGTERRARGPPRGRAGLPCEGDQPADDAGRRASRRSTAAFFGPRAALHWTGAPARISEHLAAGS